ncbi:MAG: hypothetical protein NVS4B2_31260 [Chloroflexota bacterium]
MSLPLLVAHVVAFCAGFAVVMRVLTSAVTTFVLPRGVSDHVARTVFLAMRAVFDFRTTRLDSYADRDRVQALYAPLSLLALLLVWLSGVLLGYMGMFWALGENLKFAFKISGSSLLTLGFATGGGIPETFMTFSEAGIGISLAALLVAYLPTIYSAWQRREQQVALLETRAGSPPAAWEMILRYYRIRGLDAFAEVWPAWELWFIDIEESHTSLSSVTFFRSPQPDRSWITAAGVVLDTASLLTAAVDVPRDPNRELCIRSGYLSLRRIATFFRISFNNEPSPDDSISVTRDEFDQVCDMLAAEGVPMKPDRDKAWHDFAGWRVNYDTVLLALAALTMAPYAPWISDRSNWHLGRYVFGRPNIAVAVTQPPEP